MTKLQTHNSIGCSISPGYHGEYYSPNQNTKRKPTRRNTSVERRDSTHQICYRIKYRPSITNIDANGF